MNDSQRVLGRLLAQALSPEEIDRVAGGSGGPEIPTFSGTSYPQPAVGEDDYSPTDEV